MAQVLRCPVLIVMLLNALLWHPIKSVKAVKQAYRHPAVCYLMDKFTTVRMIKASQMYCMNSRTLRLQYIFIKALQAGGIWYL